MCTIGRFATWQHNANPSYKLASIPRYDDIVRTAGWARGLRALLAADWRVTGRRSQNCAPYMGSGRVWLAGDWPSTGEAFSTLLRRPGLRASSDGVLATKSERKMLASTCLYSLYVWLTKEADCSRVQTSIIIVSYIRIVYSYKISS